MPARTKAPRSDVISCSRFTLTPPRLRYCRTAEISAGPPSIAASAMASCVAAHAAAAEKAGDGDLAGMPPQIVAAFDLADPLELLQSSDRVRGCWAGSTDRIRRRARSSRPGTIRRQRQAYSPTARRRNRTLPVSTTAQFKKSLRGSCAYLLVSKTSATLNFPTVMTSRLAVWLPANWLMPASTFCVSPPRSIVWRMNARSMRT